MSSSESEIEIRTTKKLSSQSSISRISSRQSEKAQKLWAVFDFTEDHSLLTVPASWVRTVKNQEKTGTRVKTKCLWPRKGSPDEANVRKLIRSCSNPDVGNWDVLSGVFKGFFSTLREGEAYITEKLGTISTSSSAATDRDELRSLEEKANLAIQKKSGRPSPRISEMFSNSPNTVATSVSKTRHNPSPSTTSNSILDVNATSDDESQSILIPSKRRAVDGSYNIDGAVTSRPRARKLFDGRVFSPVHKSIEDNEKENQGSRKKKDGKEERLLLQILQELRELKEDVSQLKELKEDICLIKNRIDMLDPKCTTKAAATINNPLETLRAFGFKANSLQETGG